MDTQGHDPSPSFISLYQKIDSSEHARCQGIHADASGALNSSSRRATPAPPTTCSLTSPSESREAKVRELRERIRSGTYQVASAEQIAECMLLETLCEQHAEDQRA